MVGFSFSSQSHSFSHLFIFTFFMFTFICSVLSGEISQNFSKSAITQVPHAYLSYNYRDMLVYVDNARYKSILYIF